MRKSFNYSIGSIASGALLSFIFLFSSCGKDDDNKAALIDIKDPNVVAKSVVIENATFITTGNPPAQTISETAPLLDEDNDGEPLFSVQGSKIIVSATIQNGSASGFYVKIVGADGYYKVTSTSATGRQKTVSKTLRTPFRILARTQEEGVPTFSIEVPENIKPGEFCISYCVYDAQNQVSNIIQQCVTVKSLGGENSSFLSANEWAEVKEVYYDSGQLIDEHIIGVPHIYNYPAIIPCDTSYVEIEGQQVFGINYAYLNFSGNGAIAIKSEHHEKNLDYENSNCEAVYTESTEQVNFTGAWSYDSDSKILILLYNEENEEDGGYETVAEQYETSIVDNNLILKTDDGGSGYYLITLKPKN